MNKNLYIYLIILLLLSAVNAFPQSQGTPADTTFIQNDSIITLLPSDTTKITASNDSLNKPKQIFDSPVSYKSTDSMAVSLENGDQIVFLYGDANVKYGDLELTAGYIEVNLAKKELFAKGITDTTDTIIGKPHFKESSQEFDCSSLRYNFETGKGFVEDVVTEQQDGKVHGAKAKMVTKDIFCMTDGKYSACDAEHPHYYLSITKGKIINKKAIIAGRSYIVVEDFPIYFPFLPYGYLPTNKTTYSSGIIVPSYGEITSQGFYLKDGGFYWAASDFFDVKLTGDIYTKGSWRASIDTKYKLRYKFSGSFSFSYSNTVTGEKGINQNSQPSFKVTWSHSQDTKSNPSSSFSANIDFSTSGYSKNNEYDNTEKYLENSKNSSVSFRKSFLNTPFSMTANLNISQSTSDSSLSVSFPNLTVNMKTIQPFKRKKQVGSKRFYEDFQFSYSTSIKNSISTKENEFLNTPLSQWKKGIDHNLPITLPSFKLMNYINCTPSISYKERWFFDHIEKYWVDGYSVQDRETGAQQWIDGHVETVNKDGFRRNYEYSGGIGAATTLYGLYQMKNPNAYINAIRHKIDLSLSFNYHPDFGQKKYGFYDWVQSDSLGTMQQYNIFQGGIFSSTSSGRSGSVGFSMSNNIEMKVKNLNDTTSTEKFKKVPIFDNIGFSGSYNLAADSMRLSTISLNARTKIAGTVLNITGSMNPYALNSKGKVTGHYMWETASGLAKLGRITNLSTGFSFNYGSDQIEKKRKEKEKTNSGNKENKPGDNENNTGNGDGSGNPQDMGNKGIPGNQAKNENPPEGGAPQENSRYQPFNMPWKVSFNYSIAYVNTNNEPTINQSLSFNGSVDITDKWKASLTSGFDFKALKLTYTSVSVTRNLHCWSMSFNFAPISTTPYYTFTLSANASMLKDIKVNKTNRSY